MNRDVAILLLFIFCLATPTFVTWRVQVADDRKREVKP